MLVLTRRIRRCYILAPVLVALNGFVVPAPAQELARGGSDLRASMARFLEVLEQEGQGYARPFFPSMGQWRYTRTVHEADGTDRTERWDYYAHQTWSVLICGDSPVKESLVIYYHGEGKLGSFLDQAQHRRGPWRLVGESRLVPPGAPDSSATYVEWRRERGRWVISELADEWFKGDPPAWLPSFR